MFPSSIEICSRKGRSIVPMYNSIWIHHRNNFKNNLLPEINSLWCIRKKELDKSLHHPGAHCFPRMLSSDYNYTLSLFSLFSRTWSYNNILTAIIRYSLRQRPHMKKILILLIFLYRLNKIHQLVISIRKWLSKEDLIIWVIKSEWPA